jgi:glyoxylase-like metal-dependent hydrolase (beta-lactamase superfamily II)
MWGDVTERRWFSFWTMHTGGLMYPRQTTTDWNGLPYMDWTVHDVKINPTVDETMFQIPDEAAKGFAATATRPTGMNSLTLDESRVVMVNDWITQVPGGFNVGFVKQPDGLVILEATTTSTYSASVLALAGKRYPGVPIKAVVTTSDAWPHLSGIREYAARGIPIYALDLNVPILSRMIAAPRTLTPDALSKAPQAPKVTPVTTRTTIGTGETRIELIPVRGETGERMMIAWFPGAKVLYSSDLIQRGRTAGTFFMPMMLAEVAAAAERENLGVIERVFGMHLPPTPWETVTAAIATARK